MSEFMVYFHDVFIECLAHHVRRKWHRLHQKRTIWKLIIEPAILRHLGKDVPEWQQGWCMSHTDFAATISIKRSAEATGEFAERTQCCTWVITGQAVVEATTTMDKLSQQRQGLEKSGISEFIAATTVCAFAMGQAKNNLQYYATVMPQIWHVLLTGEAPVGSKLEFFNEGIRLKNSATNRPLEYDLRDFDPAVDTAAPILKGGFDADALADLVNRLEQLAKGVADGEYSQPDAAAVRAKIVEFRDGCSDQFQCLHSFLYYQLFEWLTGIEYVNVCCQAEDGKGAADGASRVVRGVVNEAVKEREVPSSGSRGLLLLCAAKRKTPSRSAAAKMGLHTHTNYLYVYLPSDAMDNWAAKEGFVGSRAAHTFQAVEGVRSAPAADAWLEHKDRPCCCDPCLARNWDQCLIKDRHFTNARGKVQIERKSGEANLRAKKTRDSKTFRGLPTEGTVVIARVHSDRCCHPPKKMTAMTRIPFPCAPTTANCATLASSAAGIRRSNWSGRTPRHRCLAPTWSRAAPTSFDSTGCTTAHTCTSSNLPTPAPAATNLFRASPPPSSRPTPRSATCWCTLRHNAWTEPATGPRCGSARTTTRRSCRTRWSYWLDHH